jgi:hypothetical protein
VLDSVTIDMPRPRSVGGEAFERYRAIRVERLRTEVARAYRQAALIQRERVISLRDVYLPKATRARDTVPSLNG